LKKVGVSKMAADQELVSENVRLKAEVARLTAELEKLQKPASKFVESNGVLWKRKGTGGFESIAYCPTCQLAMATIERSLMPPNCSKCNFMAPFMADEIQSIVQGLA
jgi:hypothetical protein